MPLMVFRPGTTKQAPQVVADSATPAGWTFDPFTYGGLPHYQITDYHQNIPALSGTGGLNPKMHTTGDRPDIGLVTEWQAALLAGDDSYRDTVLYQGGLNVWDEGTLFFADFAHTPSLYWVPYLLTGDAKYVDGMAEQFKAYQNWQQTDFLTHPGEFVDRGRVFAWQIRNLAELAKVRPQYKPVLDAVRDYLLSAIQTCRGRVDCASHAIAASSNQGGPVYFWWMQAFVGQSLAHVVMLGNEDWRPILEWQSRIWTLTDLKYWDGYYGFPEAPTMAKSLKAYDAARGTNRYSNGRLIRESPGSRNIKARQVRSAIGMAANLGIPDMCTIYKTYDELLSHRRDGNLGPARTNPVLNCQ